MNKKAKIFISLFFIFLFCIYFQFSYSKYIIENVYTVAKLDIDRCAPIIELIDITTSNDNYSTYANKNHLISGHLKITEKNIVKNNLVPDNIKILVNNNLVSPIFQIFSLISETSTEKIYEFSFNNVTSDGILSIIITEGVIEDKSGLINKEKYFSTEICIDNTPPTVTFTEISASNNKSKAELISNEPIMSLPGWENSNSSTAFSKEFPNCILYALPVTDFAQNSSEVLIDIKNATNISINYGTYDDYSKQTLVSNGQISSPETITSNSLCKSEVIIMNLSGNIPQNSLQGKAYLYTHWGDSAYAICKYSELRYYHGYNPASTSDWINIGSSNLSMYSGTIFSQFGGRGLNVKNATASNVKIPIPEEIANQYLYGISGIQFQLKDFPKLSVVYQSFVKDVGWLKASSNGEENLYSHDKPISAFRINLVPASEKQYLINFWNRDVGTNNID